MTGTPQEPVSPSEGADAATPRQRVLNDRYELGRLIGRGGMADVWLARDLLLGRDVAVKILRSDLARDETFQARFRREAKSVAGLNDHGIVSVYDTGDTDVQLPGESAGLKVPFIVMEYVKGHTLKSRLANGPLSQRDAVNATLGVLAALAASHAQGIVHRDIKPANVMITDAGTVKVMDFGIARAVADSAATMTQTQAVVGTAQYLSPEQARGESVDARSDLYSTGCLLFELLTGRPPFVGDSPVAVAYQHVGEQAPAPSTLNQSVPAELDAVLAMALNKDRDQRFQTAQDFATALRTAQRGSMPAGAPAVADNAATQTIPAAVAESKGNDNDLAATGSWTGLIPGVSHAPAGSDPRSDQDDTKRKKRHRTIWIISAILLIALIIGSFFLVRWLQAEAERNARVAVPSVAGQTQQEAEKAIKDADLNPVAKEVFNESVDRGSVVETDPGAGMQAKKHSDVIMRVSRGPEQVTLPKNLVGKSQKEARQKLEALGFKVNDRTRAVEHEKIKKDLVTNTDPALGETVANGSEVTLLVSKGQVELPTDIEGKDQSEARSMLQDLGLKVASGTKSVSAPDLDLGKVASTDPKPGSTLKVGGEVTLLVSDGKVSIPGNLVDKDQEDVRSKLSDLGLKVTSHTEDSPKKAGTVLSTSPESGSSVNRGSSVSLTVSSGMVKIPDVVGKTESEATSLLQDKKHRLKVEVKMNHSDDKKPGTVLSQDPEPSDGSKVEPKSTVTITVADEHSGKSHDHKKKDKKDKSDDDDDDDDD